MLTIHHLGVSQSERIVCLCEELSIAYDLVRYERNETQAAPPAYKTLHPAGTAPIITDDEIVLAETGAIFGYILLRYGKGRLIVATQDADFPNYLFWLHYANGSMIPAFMMDVTAARVGVASASDRSRLAFRVVEERLGNVPWFAGDRFTAADIMMVFPLTRAGAFSGSDMADMPNLQTYLARINERPALQAAMNKAEPGRSNVAAR